MPSLISCLANTGRSRTLLDKNSATGHVLGWPEKKVKEVSGHSIRVGATQDLLELNIDLASVMQAGRWKSTAMPMRYGENVLAARGGMARAAEIQGRNQKEMVTEKEG